MYILLANLTAINATPNHCFGYKKNHSIIEDVQRIIYTVEEPFRDESVL